MTHSEFNTALAAKRVLALVTDSKFAMKVAGASSFMPLRYKLFVRGGLLIALACLVGGIYLTFAYKWWIGLLLVFLVTPTLEKFVRHSSAGFVVSGCKRSPELYQVAVDSGLLHLEPVQEIDYA